MSYKRKMLTECIKEYRNELVRDKASAERKANLIEILEKHAGLSLISDHWGLRYSTTYKVKLSDIKKIKEIVGSFEETFGKQLCSDFDETGEIWIECTVADGLYKGWKFNYRHWLSDDDDCKVTDVKTAERTIPASSYKTLQCPSLDVL